MKPKSTMRSVSHLSLLALLITLACSGCYAKHFSLEGEMPKPAPVQTIPATAGIERGSIGNNADDVANAFASRLTEEKVFNAVIYPLTPAAAAKPDLLIKLDCSTTEETNMAVNTIKAILIGGTFFALAPVLPIQFELTVEANARVYDGAGTLVNKYSAKSYYRLAYTKFLISEEDLASFEADAKKHAVEQLVNEIKADREKLVKAAGVAAANRPDRRLDALAMVY